MKDSADILTQSCLSLLSDDNVRGQISWAVIYEVLTLNYICNVATTGLVTRLTEPKHAVENCIYVPEKGLLLEHVLLMEALSTNVSLRSK